MIDILGVRGQDLQSKPTDTTSNTVVVANQPTATTAIGESVNG